MTFNLDCDSCGFANEVDEEVYAYTDARDHEAEHPSHVVVISETREG